MTLILAIPVKDGVVIASDGQITSGMVRWQGKKIKKLNDTCLWGASGEEAVIQRVEERINARQNDQPLANQRDFLANLIRESVTALLDTDFRTQFFRGDPNALLKLHPGDFIFAEYRSVSNVYNLKILHITANGTPEWIDKPFCSGSGDLFTYALLQKYMDVTPQIDVLKASLLAFKVIEETIQVGAYGLGPPIDIWQITKKGIENLQDEKIAALGDSSRTLRQAEIKLLTSEQIKK